MFLGGIACVLRLLIPGEVPVSEITPPPTKSKTTINNNNAKI